MTLFVKKREIFKKTFDKTQILCYIMRLAGVLYTCVVVFMCMDRSSWRSRQIFGKWLMLNCLPEIWRLC